MKLRDKENFALGSPTLICEISSQARSVEAVQAQFAWLVSLPIAAGIFQQDGTVTRNIATNRMFDALVIDDDREAGLDLSVLSQRICQMIADDRESHFECWKSTDQVHHRELDINIARFGEARDMFMLSLIDRTAEAVGRINLRREILSDSLTGFFNRVGFEEEAENITRHMTGDAPSAPSKYAVLLIDLARFSRVNESVGALAGDELIITVARRLKSRTRANEILARLGSNEFALFVLLGAECETIEHIAARLDEAFAEPCRLSNLEIQVECAIAAAIGDVGADDLVDTLQYAQIALKRAKSSKRFELYSPGSIASAQQRFSLETDLRRAIQRDELCLHYQPLMDLETGVISGFEALARWEHPDLGFISPMDFIPVAEESGLIVPLGRWALAEAARTIRDWDAMSDWDYPIKISVNMSAVQMLRDDVVQAVSDAINGAGISGDRLMIELTESAFVDNPEGAKKILESLKSLDTSLAMDDFGTGYSNLAYLQKLPIDVLKIDRSFITDMLVDKDKRAIVRTVLSLADALGMRTTAEGIESEAISNDLRKLGCSVGQGFYFARPLTKDAAYRFLAASRLCATA